MRNGRARAWANDAARGMTVRCEAVYQAALVIATDLSLDSALQKIADAARKLVGAQYGALGVVDEEGKRLTRFVVSGISDREVRAIEHWPRGLGLLGELIHFPHPLRVKDISKDPRSVGVPPHHPAMTSFLGVPVLRGDRILGNFYMTNKRGAEEFTEEDEEILSLFATHAAIAIENARLYTETDIRLKEKVVEVEQAERRARFLAELGALLLRLPPGEELPLESVAERATEPLGDVVALFLLDPEAPDTARAATVFHRLPTRREVAREVLERSWAALRERVIVHGGSELAAVPGEQAGSVFDAQILERGRFAAALAVPIATRQTTYGLLASLASRPLTLGEDDLRFAGLIADRLGSALDSVRVHRREQEAKAKVQELADLAQHRASELETILDTMNEAVWVVDPRGGLTRTNRAYGELVGFREGEGMTGPALLPLEGLDPRDENGEPLPADMLPVARALRGEIFTNQVVLITRAMDGKESFLNLSGAPIRDPSGRTLAAVIVARDVTETKELDRLRDEFISVASHELKTPLTVVKGYGQILAQKLEAMPDRRAEADMARHILDQSEKLSALADRLLDVSRLQLGRLQLEKQRVDLARLVDEVSERMRITVQNHPLRVLTDKPIPALVDSERIEQVLTNLISNAAKYSPDGTEIEVALRRRKGEALISVRDHGFGIPETQQPYIFQRFFRASTSLGRKGLGLGLYVSKGIVEAHGGRIWFESEEGKGTTFHVALRTE